MFVFAYGSLQIESIWNRVAGVRCKTTPGVAPEYSAYRVQEQVYPGMIAEPGGRVPGVVYLDVPAPAVARLDRFEGAAYSRCPIEVRIEEGRMMQCQAYLFQPAEELTRDPWLLSEFLQSGAAQRFAARYVGFTAVQTNPDDA